MSDTKPRFFLGRMVSTRDVADLMTSNPDFANFVSDCLHKYIVCDWGDTCKHDAHMNNSAVKTGNDRILAVYKFPKNCSWTAQHWGQPQEAIWIITESDHSATTVLFPSEY